MTKLLTKFNSISEKGEGTKKKTILSLTERFLLKISDNTLLVKFNSKLPENKTTLAKDTKKATSPGCQVSVVKHSLHLGSIKTV
jgi:hypothetical protein